MSAPAIYHPIIKQGVPFERWIELTDSNNQPVPLTDAVFAGNVRNQQGAVIADIEFTPDPLIANRVKWGIADTTTLPPTLTHELPYDIFITPAGGQRICPVEGQMLVEAAQTELAP